MNIEEIKEYLDTNKESQEVIDFMKSIQRPITRDVVEAWCQEGEGKSWLDRNCDIYSSKAVNTARENAIAKFKKDELPKLIEEGIKAKSNEGLTPEQLEIKQLKEQMEQMKAEATKSAMRDKYTKVLGEKGLSIELIDFVLGKDEDTTNSNIEKLNTIISESVNAGVQSRIKNSEYVPPKAENNIGGGKLTWNDVVDNPALMSKYNEQQAQ